MAEHSAVNRRVVGSSPTCGAKDYEGRWNSSGGLLSLPRRVSNGNRLDQQIKNDLIANATIDFITSVLSDVSRLRAITDAHKA